MGCKVSPEPIKQYMAAEPFDIQMECILEKTGKESRHTADGAGYEFAEEK